MNKTLTIIMLFFALCAITVSCGDEENDQPDVVIEGDDDPIDQDTNNIPTVNADFPYSPINILTTDVTRFTHSAISSAASWTWTFEGGSPATSTDMEPMVIFSTPGIYSVSLTIDDGPNEEIITDLDYVIAAHAHSDEPPYGGTIFLSPDIITENDHSTFIEVEYIGTGLRTMYDRRVNTWVELEPHLINATFENDITLEVQVNPEFNVNQAMNYAEFYSSALGRIPVALFEDAKTVWIHDGVEPFGGGNNNFLIHVGQGDQYIISGILEETLVHEGAHTSLDDDHADSDGWRSAQDNDFAFISRYARDFPDREDVAESYLCVLAATQRRDRISDDLFNVILGTMPERIRYFNDQNLNEYPITP